MRLLPLALAAWCLATCDAWLPPLCQPRLLAAPSNLAANMLQRGAVHLRASNVGGPGGDGDQAEFKQGKSRYEAYYEGHARVAKTGPLKPRQWMMMKVGCRLDPQTLFSSVMMTKS